LLKEVEVLRTLWTASRSSYTTTSVECASNHWVAILWRRSLFRLVGLDNILASFSKTHRSLQPASPVMHEGRRRKHNAPSPVRSQGRSHTKRPNSTTPPRGVRHRWMARCSITHQGGICSVISTNQLGHPGCAAVRPDDLSNAAIKEAGHKVSVLSIFAA
jgi:hypothetical protein